MSIRRLEKICGMLGLNSAVSYTAGAKLFQAAVQFAVLAAMARKLSPSEQGYYYTFQSVLALQVFFELGMTNVLVQVTSHEAATLNLMDGILPQGKSEAIDRLASLLRYLVRWYLRASSLFFVFTFAAGVVFFLKSKGGLEIRDWVGPWLLSTFTTAVSMLFQALVAFIEGVGRISRAAKIRAVQGVTTIVTLFVAMSMGAGLYSPGLALFAGLTAGALFFFVENRTILVAISSRYIQTLQIAWTKDLWGFQWRMALSWVSGFLIFQFSTPVVFKLLGSVEAGKYGITQQVCNGISALSMAWATTRQAQWGRWIATGDRTSLDRDFKITIKRTVGINGLLACMFLIFMLVGMHWVPQYVRRFAPFDVALILMIWGVLNQIVFTEALYLRAHKTEPFLVTSIVGGVIMGLGSPIVARFGIFALASLYLYSTIVVGLVWGTKIFFAEKNKWEKLAKEKNTKQNAFFSTNRTEPC